MNSIVLCEGSDDLWFVAYYLHKTAGWNECKNPKRFWKNYRLAELNDKQSIKYFSKDKDCVAIWSVSGKDGFSEAISTITNKFIAEMPADAPEAIVILRDRDDESERDVVSKIEEYFSKKVSLKNKESSIYIDEVDDIKVSIAITPVIVPFDKHGAIETVFIEAVKEKGDEEAAVVNEANNYIDCLVDSTNVGIKYLNHERLILKARYASVIAATNPDHSTALFQEMVMACPWESSEYVARNFGIIAEAVTSQLV